jgi:peptide/nickel transport system permease protein
VAGGVGTIERGEALLVAERATRGRLRRMGRRFVRRPGALIGAVVIVVFVAVAITAPAIAPEDPNAIDTKARREAPTDAHLLGTDELGRDVLSRIIYGARVSLRVGLISIGIALTGGTILGVIAGYFGRWADTLIMRVTDVMLAFPGILLAIAIVAILGPVLFNLMVAVGIEAIPVYARTARASTLATRGQEFVVGARAAGAGHPRLLLRHILPNIVAPLIVLATIGVAGSILAAAGLSYLGLGAQPPTAEWGAMLSSARTYVRDAWWMATFPGVAIMLVVLALNLFGDGLRDILDPRLRD